MKTSKSISAKQTRALLLALSLVGATALTACSTTSTNDSNNGTYVRRAERIADQLPRGGG